MSSQDPVDKREAERSAVPLADVGSGHTGKHLAEIVRAACAVAGLDERICKHERPMLQRIAKAAGVGTVCLNAMLQRAENDPDFFEEMFNTLRTDPETTVRQLLRVAAVDGEIARNERIVLSHLAQKLGMAEQRFAALLDEAEQRLQAETRQ